MGNVMLAGVGRLGCVVCLALTLLATTSVAQTALADEWETSFDPALVGLLKIPGRTRITLVAPGKRTTALALARASLAEAIKASRQYTLVDGDLVREMDPDIKDAAVLELEREARDVEAIWIMRASPTTSKLAAPSVIVMIYAPLGPLLNAIEVVEGQPLRVVAKPIDPAAEFLRQRISPVVGGRIVTSPDPEVFALDGGFAKDGVKLSEPRALYIAMGRYDLLGKYDSVAEDRSLATIISGGVMFLGVVLVMQDVFDSGGIPTASFGAVGNAGFIAAGLGTVGLVYARTIDPDPLDARGRIEAATTYNGGLKQRLGVAANTNDAAPGGARVTAFSVAPLSDGLALNGLALTLGGAF